jgi:hypothetical protein
VSATINESVLVADDEEVLRYEQAFRETRRVLDEGIRQLAILLKEESNSARRDQIALKRLRLQRDRTRLANANIAFHTGNALMNPPSAALVEEIVGLATEASTFVVERVSASAVLSLATLALTKFAEIQDIGP